MRTRSIQCHNNPFLVPFHKSPNIVRDLYDRNIFETKTRVDIWMMRNVYPVEYGTLAQTFHLIIWLFQYVSDIYFRWNDAQ